MMPQSLCTENTKCMELALSIVFIRSFTSLRVRWKYPNNDDMGNNQTPCAIMNVIFNYDYLIINTNNYKTSIVPIFSKWIELRGIRSADTGTMESSSTMIRWQVHLGTISKSENMSFQMVTERILLFDDLTCSESEFQRVGTATEKEQVPAWVVTLGTDNKWKPNDWSYLGLGAKDSMENRHERFPEERVW